MKRDEEWECVCVEESQLLRNIQECIVDIIHFHAGVCIL